MHGLYKGKSTKKSTDRFNQTTGFVDSVFTVNLPKRNNTYNACTETFNLLYDLLDSVINVDFLFVSLL